MSGLAGLGALAGGFAQGMERKQRMEANQQALDANRRRADDEEALRRDLRSADQAMGERLRGFELEHQQSQSPVNRALTLGGTDSSMPDQTALDQAPAMSPFRPNQQQLLDAAQARTDKLFALGRHDQAVKQWAQDEGLRAQMRKQAVEKGMLAFKASGDITPLLSGVYGTIDDGYDLGGVQPVNNPDPKAPRAWDVERVNRLTGERSTQRINEGEVDGLMQFALDPQQAARYALMEKLAGYRAEQQRQTNSDKHDDRMEEIGLSNDGRVDVAKLAAASREQVAKMNFDGRIRVAEIRGAGGGKGGASGTAGNVARTVNLADGRVLLIMRNGDQRIASGDDGKPLTSLEYQRLIGQTASAVGKSVDGMTATPEENFARAEKILPKPPPANPSPQPAPRQTLGDIKPPKRPPLSTFNLP